MRVPKIPILAFTLTVLIMSCRKSSPVEPQQQPPQQQPDTNWVTQPQVDIPWPGLANSAWPMFMHDPQHTGRSPYRGPQLGQMEWLFNANGNVYSSPALDVNGNIYFAVLQGSFFSVTPYGAQRWSVPGGSGDCAPLIGNDGTIYVFGGGTSQYFWYLYAYDPLGNLKWQAASSGTIYGDASPVISKDGGTIYVPEMYLNAIRRDGTQAWRIRPDSTDGVLFEPAMSPDGSTLYVSGQNALYAIDTSGSLKWKFAGVPCSPSVDNAGNIYFASGWRMYSLYPNGSLRWSLDGIASGAFDTGPAIGRDGTIYIAGNYLYAIDYAGKLRWKYAVINGSGSMPAIDIDGTIYFGRNTTRTATDSVNFIALNSNGTVKFLASLRSPDGTIPDIDSRPAISSDGKIYVGSDRPHGFHLYKVR